MIFSRMQHSMQRAFLVVAAVGAGCPATWAQGRTPEPDSETQARAQQLVLDVYGKEFDAAKTSKQKTELAKKLLDQASKSKGDPAGRFVLLRVAKDMLVLAGDAQTAMAAVERIAATYDVDAMDLRLDCMKRLAAAAKLSPQRRALAEQAYSLIDVALVENNFEAASQFGEIARESARRARDYSLLKEVVARMKKSVELQQAHAEYRKTVARLEEDPTDPQANLAVGRYLCVAKGDWDRAVPMLALGSDAALKAAASGELKGATTPEARVALGDAWWDLAQTRQGRQKEAFLHRAGHWYQKAAPGLTSALMKLRVENRLKEVAKIEAPAPPVAATGTPPQEQPDPDTTVQLPQPDGQVSTPGLTPDKEGWILLAPLVQPDRDAQDARWKWDGQAASLSAGKPRARISIPVRVAGSYELQTRVTIVRAKESTSIWLPITSTRSVVFGMKGDRGNSAASTATMYLKGMKPEPPPQGNVSMDIGTEYALSCKVVGAGDRVAIEIRRDGQILFQWAGFVSQVAERSMIRPATVQLDTGYYSIAQFVDLRLKMLSGQAALIVAEDDGSDDTNP